MKLPICLLVALVWVKGFATEPAPEPTGEVGIARDEFERLWKARSMVTGVVDKFIPGKGNALTYEYDGHLHFASDDIAEISLLNPGEKKPRKLHIAVSRDESEKFALFKESGAQVEFSVPLLYLKYDLCGFVPSDEVKALTRKKLSPANEKTDKATQNKPADAALLGREVEGAILTFPYAIKVKLQDVSKVEPLPVPLKQALPEYPFEMRRQAVSGLVKVRVIITKKGEVASLSIIHASHAAFVPSVEAAVKSWRFTPKTIAGQSVASEMIYIFEFMVFPDE